MYTYHSQTSGICTLCTGRPPRYFLCEARGFSVSWGLENGPHPQLWQEQELQRVASWGQRLRVPYAAGPRLPMQNAQITKYE